MVKQMASLGITMLLLLYFQVVVAAATLWRNAAQGSDVKWTAGYLLISGSVFSAIGIVGLTVSRRKLAKEGTV